MIALTILEHFATYEPKPPYSVIPRVGLVNIGIRNLAGILPSTNILPYFLNPKEQHIFSMYLYKNIINLIYNYFKIYSFRHRYRKHL